MVRRCDPESNPSKWPSQVPPNQQDYVSHDNRIDSIMDPNTLFIENRILPQIQIKLPFAKTDELTSLSFRLSSLHPDRIRMRKHFLLI